MPVVLLVAAAVILVGVIVVAVGRGGEMAEFSADVRPVDTDIETAADVALLRPPVALWGYDRRSTDEALNVVARTVTERDVEIATLRRQVADLQAAWERPSGREPDAATHRDAARGPDGGEPGVQQGATWEPGTIGGADAASEPGAATQPGQAGPGSDSPQFVRRQASPVPPPAETLPWSAWERPGPAQRPDPGEPADPEQTG